jgi:hypothetical protein
MPSEVVSGSQLPPAVLESPGDQSLSITIEKMGFKDATVFIDPFFTVSLTGKPHIEFERLEQLVSARAPLNPDLKSESWHFDLTLPRKDLTRS